MYGCELDHKRRLSTDELMLSNLWYWRRLLRVLRVLGLLRAPQTARKSNQSILKEINPEYSLEGLMLKLQYFGHLMQRADSLEKTLMLGKIEGRTRQQTMRQMVGRHHRLNGHEFKQTPGHSEGQGSLVYYSSWDPKESDTT